MAGMISQVTLEDLLLPHTISTFFEYYWQRRPLVIPGDTTDRFNWLLSLRDVELLVSSLGATDSGWLALAKAEASEMPQVANRDKLVDLGAVFRAYADGYTIILTKVHRRLATFGALCRKLETTLLENSVPLSARVGVNVYLSPAHSKCFPVHADDHDVLILQVEGSKVWSIYEADVLHETSENGAQLTATAAHNATTVFRGDLGAGSVIYIPKGVPHEAMSTDHHSLHVTISFRQFTWSDLLFRLASADAAMNQSLPPLPFPVSTNAFREELSNRVSSILSAHLITKCLDEMSEEFKAKADLPPGKSFAQLNGLPRVGLKTLVKKRKDVPVKTQLDGGDTIRLRFAGLEYTLPSQLQPFCDIVGQGKEVLVDNMPDCLTEHDKILLARQLIQAGLIEALTY